MEIIGLEGWKRGNWPLTLVAKQQLPCQKSSFSLFSMHDTNISAVPNIAWTLIFVYIWCNKLSNSKWLLRNSCKYMKTMPWKSCLWSCLLWSVPIDLRCFFMLSSFNSTGTAFLWVPFCSFCMRNSTNFMKRQIYRILQSIHELKNKGECPRNSTNSVCRIISWAKVVIGMNDMRAGSKAGLLTHCQNKHTQNKQKQTHKCPLDYYICSI